MQNVNINERASACRDGQLEQIAPPLLRWYKSQARILPWREDPRPYRVWISEIMLQQTRVEAVKPYFDRFIRALPSVEALARVPTDELLKLWEGLGYYNRARNLQKAAQEIMARYGGKLPPSYEELLTLPGIGRYTAGAIASIAFSLPVPAVDGNVLRVVCRMIANREDVASEKVKRAVEQKLMRALPKNAAGEFNQALMELGATVCLPKGAAKCPLCPLKQLCLSYAWEITHEIPVKSPKKARRVEEKTIFLFAHQDKVAFCRRPAKGLLAGMWELPHAQGLLTAEEAEAHAETLGLFPHTLRPLPEAKHMFTHVEWRMIGYAALLKSAPSPSPFRWVGREELAEDIAVPTAFKAYTSKIAEFVGGFGEPSLF